jgi:hypothetical protein
MALTRNVPRPQKLKPVRFSFHCSLSIDASRYRSEELQVRKELSMTKLLKELLTTSQKPTRQTSSPISVKNNSTTSTVSLQSSMRYELGSPLTELRSRVQRLMSCGWVSWVHRVRYSGNSGSVSGRCEIRPWRGMLRRDSPRYSSVNFASDDRCR